jgi:cysteine desulfurase
MVYLDNAATTALDPRVLEKMLPYFTEVYGNPSAIHGMGRSARLAIEESRKKVAQLLVAKPAEIFFTSCGTESTNTVLQAAVRHLGCKHIITSPIEHHATLHTAEKLGEEFDVQVHLCKHQSNGEVDYEDLKILIEKCAADAKTMVSIMHANNEIGIINDIERIGNIVDENGAFFHTDMVQTVGHVDISLSDLPVHFASASAHKFHGPKGKGMLYICSTKKIEPFLLGGGQERNMRAGTEDVAGIVGFARALELSLEDIESENTHCLNLKKYCWEELLKSIPAIKKSTVCENTLSRVLSVLLPHTSNTEMLQMSLDIKGIAVSGGSACSSGALGGSHVINFIQKDACVPLRISFSKWNTKKEVDELIDALKSLLA